MADHSDDLANPFPSPRLVEIPLNEYQGYYCTRHGRLFPRHRLPSSLRDEPDAPLPSVLPVDAAEMERREVQHNMVALALHKNWFGPFGQHLTTPPEDKIVLDIGSDNGKWIEEISEEFQNARFHGVEIVPLSPMESPGHTVFEVYDFQRDKIRQRDSSVDVIHARFQNFHIQDWKDFLQDAARALKPGGLFMSGEIDIPLQSLDGQPFNAPATNQLYTRVQTVMRERGYTPEIGISMPRLLGEVLNPQGAAAFTNISSDVIPFPMSRNNPIVDRREISTLSMECLDRLAKSLRPFLLSTGQASVEVDGLLTAHRHELRAITAQMNYRITWAERR